MWNRHCCCDYSVTHRDGYRILRNVFDVIFGGEFMYGYGCGVGRFAGVGVIAIAVLILIALGIIF